MEITKQLNKQWDELKRKYNNIYLDLEIVSELNKKGVMLKA
tara:strand:+ start:731 stop:853 length:123 start_codon:yes stop_codon:yes gene_type:complete